MAYMKLVTVATRSEAYFPWLLASCRRFGDTLTVLGWGQKWKGFAWRFQLVTEYLRSLDPKEVVCFVDGYDVILLRPLSDLEEKFKDISKRTKCKIVVGYEGAMNPFIKYASKVVFDTCNNLPINAGTYAGYAGDLLEIIQSTYAINPRHDADDQELLTSYCKKYPSDVYIDTKKELFLSAVSPQRATDGKSLLALAGDSMPCVFHGPGCLNMDGLLDYLGYDITEKQKAEISSYRRQTLLQKVVYYAKIIFGHSIPWVAAIFVVYMIFARVKKRSFE